MTWVLRENRVILPTTNKIYKILYLATYTKGKHEVSSAFKLKYDQNYGFWHKKPFLP